MAMETISYRQWLDDFKRKWKPGQHVLLIGHTGSGKTVAAQDMLMLRKYCVVVATKARDESLDSYVRHGYRKLDEWPPAWNVKKVIFWRKPKALGDFRGQQVGIYQVMSDIFVRGAWCIAFDDLIYVCNTLKLKEPVKMFYTQARSQNISIVSNLQRPFWAPLEAISQSTYALVFAAHDEHDIRRLAEGLSIPFKELLAAIKELGPYQSIFLETGRAPVRVEKKEL